MPKFPIDLESQYSKQIVKFMKSVNKEYNLFLRQLLQDKEFKNRLNSFEIRFNVFNFQKFRKKLLALRDKIFKKKTFDNIFESMSGVFKRLDKRIIKDIKKSYRKRKFPIPEIPFKAPSEMLETAIERNVALIQSITEKNVDNLEASVLSALEAGSDFDIIVQEVQKQSQKGEAYAEFVARDQLNKAYSAVNKERQESSGFDKYRWQATTGDWDNVRDSHKEAHGERGKPGKIYSWSDPPLVGGRTLHPGEDYQCRCIAIPVFD